jgi:hypothetical protein
MKMISCSPGLEAPPQILSVRVSVLPECLKSNAPDGMVLHHLVSHIPKGRSVRQGGAFSSEPQYSLQQLVTENDPEAAQYRDQQAASAQYDYPVARGEALQIEC